MITVTFERIDNQFSAVCREHGAIIQIIASANEAQVRVWVEWHYPGAVYVS